MTKSLPGVADLRLGANHPRMWTRRVQGTVVNVGVKVLPWIPTLPDGLVHAPTVNLTT